ncbi:MAG: hypothetical protein H0V67_01980 [Geodermatophilaceae bacterium]|nr:hypothetical protein [Geodermatophilaceae bacterium]
MYTVRALNKELRAHDFAAAGEPASSGDADLSPLWNPALPLSELIE